MGNEGLWSVQNSSSLPLFLLHSSPILQCGFSMGHSSFRRYPEAAAWGPPQATVWISADCCLSMGFRGISFPVPGAPPPLLLISPLCSL